MNKKSKKTFDEKEMDDVSFDFHINEIEKQKLFLDVKSLDIIKHIMIYYFKEYNIINEDEEINIFLNNDDKIIRKKLVLVPNKNMNSKDYELINNDIQKIKNMEIKINKVLDVSLNLISILINDVFEAKGELIKGYDFIDQINSSFNKAIIKHQPDYFIKKEKEILDKNIRNQKNNSIKRRL